MAGWLRAGLALGLNLLAVVPAVGQEREPYLAGPQGPYRGQVVELLSEKPLPDAVVIMLWESDPDGDGGRAGFAIREAVTDANGRFVLDASTVESNLPPRTWWPGLMVYKPGYVTMPREGKGRFGVSASRFTGAGGLVQLAPARDEEERAEAFNMIVPFLGAPPHDRSRPLLPEATRLAGEEFQRFLREAAKEQERSEPK